MDTMVITKQDFIRELGDSGRATADLAVEAVMQHPESFSLLLDISFNEPYPACMRAARAAQLCCEKDPELILPWLEEVVEKMAESKVSGVKRNYLKVISEFTGPQALADPGRLTQLCFDWLMSPREDPGVRIHCAGILFKLSEVEKDLRPELISVLEFVSEEGSTGFKNVCEKLLKKLTKQH